MKSLPFEDTSNKIKKAYLFDIDGVLTDPEAIKIKQFSLIDELVDRLQQGCPVGFNTGLSVENMNEIVLRYLIPKVTDKKLLRNVIVIAEKGGVTLTYSEKGEPNESINHNIKVPNALVDEIKKLVEKPQYSSTLEVNPTKQTLITLVIRSKEERKDKTFEDFQQVQEQLTQELKKLLEEQNLENEFRVDKTTIAIDVESKQVGKDYGTKKFVDLLQERGIETQGYLCFGDSASDYFMYEELQHLGKQTKFIFVGDKKALSGKNIKDIIFTKQKADKGTLEFLQSE